MHLHLPTALLVACSSACAATATTIPPDHLSAAGEAREARRDERAAGVAEMQAAFDVVPLGCHQRSPNEVCWPIARWSPQYIFDEATAEDDRAAAQEHRRVSLALRETELNACTGVDERDLAPGEVVDAQVIQGPDGVAGARTRFHDLRHLSSDDLRRSLDCRVARDDALGHESPHLGYCPLVPRGASATVTTLPHGYLLEVRSSTPSIAREIARCAMAALKP